MGVDRRQPARGQRQRDQRGSEEPQPALPRHRVRVLHLVDRRQGVEAVHERAADGARRRHPRAPARQRSHPRHARPQHLDHRRHHAAAADDRRDRRRATRTCSTCARRRRGSTTSRRRTVERRQALPRPESAARHGDQLLAEGRGDRRRQDHDQRLDRARGPRDGRHEGRRAESRAVEPRRRPRSSAAGLAAVAAAAGRARRWPRRAVHGGSERRRRPAPTSSSSRSAARS